MVQSIRSLSSYPRNDAIESDTICGVAEPRWQSHRKKTLRITNGQCHGDFTLSQLPFYSGYYEVRAYTKYMLNFDDDVVFSRVFRFSTVRQKMATTPTAA